MNLKKMNELAPVPRAIVYGADTEDFFRFARARQLRWREKNCGERYDDLWENDWALPLTCVKFTNAYRILDRMSQFMVQVVNGRGSVSEETHAAQIYLARLYNWPETYEKIPHIDDPLQHLDEILSWTNSTEEKIFNTCYMRAAPWPLGEQTWGSLYIKTLRTMWENGDLLRAYRSDDIEELYNIFVSQRGFGEFLAYQYALDYSYLKPSIDYESFIVFGPGAKKGFKLVYPEMPVKYCAAVAKTIAAEGILDFPELVVNGTTYRLRGNDVQNLFCEYSKYRRAFEGRIKMIYNPVTPPGIYEPQLPETWKV